MEILRNFLPHKEVLDLSHHNALFSQMLSLIPGHVFQKLEHRHRTGRLSRKFGFREQFTVMAFIRLAARRSMRDGPRCPGAAGTRLYHWGLKTWPAPPLLMPAHPGPWHFFRTCSPKCTACARERRRSTSLVSNPDCSASTPLPSGFVCRFFSGLHSVSQKAASGCTPCWTTTVISRPSLPSPMPKPTKAGWSGRWNCPGVPSWSSIKAISAIPGSEHWAQKAFFRDPPQEERRVQTPGAPPGKP